MSRKLQAASSTAKIYILVHAGKGFDLPGYFQRRWWGGYRWSVWHAEATLMTLSDANTTLTRVKKDKPAWLFRLEISEEEF